MSRLELMALLVLVSNSLIGASCDPDGCIVGETRCNLNRAEICASDTNWNVNINCDEIGGDTQDWTCCWIPEDPVEGTPAGHTCLPVNECPASDDASGDDV